MNEIKKILIALSTLLFIILLIIFLSKREKNVYTFPNTIKLYNVTNYEVDTVTKIILHKIFEIDTAEILYVYMPFESNPDDNIRFLAFIQKNKYSDKKYIIFLSRYIKSNELNRVLSHELIHLYQYHSKRLITIDEEFYIFDGDTLNGTKIPYNKRPQEINAFKNENRILNKLDSLLYK